MIKMRRLCFLVLAVALLSGLCACGKNSVADSGTSAASSTEPAIPDSATLESVTPDLSAPSLTDPEPTVPEPIVEEDPYDVLKMDEDAMSYLTSNLRGIYLLRNGNYYTLGFYITEEKASKHQVGWIAGKTNKYLVQAYINNGDYRLALGNIPAVSIETDDMIVGYGLTSLGLTPATLEGYTISAVTGEEQNYRMNYCYLYPSPNEAVEIATWNVKQFEMMDSQGNAVPQIPVYQYASDWVYRPDFADLVRGETYTVSWFEGTTYRECTMAANSPYYTINWSKPNRISTYIIEGELHKEGYASFDLSDIPPGLYCTSEYGFIYIPE